MINDKNQMHDIFLLSAAVCYLAAVTWLYLSVLRSSSGGRRIAVALTLTGAAFHSVGQFQHWFASGAPEISFLNVLSLCALVVVLLLVVSIPLRTPVFDAGLVALPIAAVVLLAEAMVDAPGSLLEETTAESAFHIISSIMAYGVLSIAGVYALFAALIDHFLKKHRLNRLVRALPALDVLEALLFQLISAGLVLLTLSLGSGLLFVNDLLGQHLAHKTILSIIAWLIFGLLLWGRYAWGWRGRLAVRMTIAGIIVLLLSYFGSKLVLEVLLGRSWNV